MHADWLSLGAAVGGALIPGLALAWALAIRGIRLGPAPVLAAIVLIPLIPRGYLPHILHELLIGALLMLAVVSPKFQAADLVYGNAVRSLGASEWRILWRVLTPLSWRAILDGLLLVLLARVVRSFL
jgi:ABC-type spermidine/putrescine transport system permease subunit II